MTEMDSLKRWRARIAVAHMAYDAGYYNQAIRHFRLALELAQTAELDETLKARSQSGLAKSLAALGKFEEAERLIRSALQIDESVSEAIVEQAEDYHQLALLCWRSGRNSESMSFAQKAFELAQKAGTAAPDDLKAKLLKHFAVLAEQSGDFVETERCLNRAVEFIEGSNQLGKNSMIYGDVLLVKVLFLAEQGRFDEAAELYPYAMQIVALTRGVSHPRVEEAMKIFQEMDSKDTHPNDEKLMKMASERDSSNHGIL